MNGLSLCAGIGGLDLGVSIAVPDYRAVCFVEREAFAVSCLVAQMANGTLAPAPVWDDLFTFDGRRWRGVVDCITAGLPCQPYSVAGKRRGHDDERALWPQFIRIIDEVRPALVFLENVAAFVAYFRPVGERLSGLGYRLEAGIYSAAEIGAPHRRERFFMLAYRNGAGFSGERSLRLQRAAVHDPDGCSGQAVAESASSRRAQARQYDGGSSSLSARLEQRGRAVEYALGSRRSQAWERCDQHAGDESQARCGSVEDADLSGTTRLGEHSGALPREHDIQALGEPDRSMGDADESGSQGRGGPNLGSADELPAWPPSPSDYERWRFVPEELKPAIRRVVDGSAARVDRLRALGNGVVPIQAAFAFSDLARKLGVMR